ncbi:MAG: hypothetical protein OXG13_23495 [Gemmatimonadaceae bacterium]|nr:hypothetical protein [Gemmatimonadaceae bacterium]
MRAGRAVVAALIAAAVTSACGPPPPVQRQGWAAGAGEIAGVLGADFAAVQGLDDLTAEARLTLTHEQGRNSLAASMLFRPPDLLRLDVQGPLFQHVLSAVIEADTLLALVEGRRLALQADDGLEYFLGIDLGGYDPRWTLLGVVLPGEPDTARVRLPGPGRAVVPVEASPDLPPRRLTLDLHRGFVVGEAVLDDSGEILWSRRLQRFRRLPGTDVYLPRSVRIESGGRILELEYGKVRLDRGLERAAFFTGLR